MVLGSSNTASGGLTDSQKNKIDSARNYLVSLRAEIERINGTGEDFGIKLVQKLDEIEKKAKVAGLSLHEIQTLKDAYSGASISKLYRDQSDALRDVDIQIATMRGDAAKVRMLEVEKATDELTRKLTQLQISEPERASKVTEFKVAKEQEFQIKDLQTAADFYQKLADLSGNYNATTEYQNQLLEAQARIYAESLGPGHEKYIEQWKELMQLQNSRDYADGITRGLKKWTGEYTNMAMQMEGFTTSTLGAMTEGLLDFTSRTSASFSDMTRSILQDLARITARMAMAGLIKTAVGFFSAPGGGTATATASVSGNSISGGWAEGFMSRGSSYAAIVKHGGGMALEPSPTRRVPASFFEGAPRYHTGFINPAYERAAIIRTDESVLTPGQMKAIAGAGGASVVNNIAIVPPDGYEGKEARTANATGGEDIRVTFGRIAAQQANTYGSELNVALRRQGTRMPVMRSGG